MTLYIWINKSHVEVKKTTKWFLKKWSYLFNGDAIGNDLDLEATEVIGVGLGEFIKGRYDDPILVTDRTLVQDERPKTDLNMLSEDLCNKGYHKKGLKNLTLALF